MLICDFKEIISSKIDWNRFAGKTILITGAAGFLPAYMAEVLLKLNENILRGKECNVIALVRNKNQASIRFKKYINSEHFSFLIQDVSLKIDVKEKIDFIIHAASPASPKVYGNNPLSVISPNIYGTKNTLDLAVEHNVEGYLYFSSGEVYGATLDDVITEDSYGFLDPVNIRSCYAESKRMAENICVCYGQQYDLAVKIIRPFHTYGPGMKLDDGRVFADFVKNIVMNEDIEMKSDGSAIRPFCYLADATEAYFRVLLNGATNQPYNVGNPYQSVSIKELANILVGLFPDKHLLTKFGKPDKSYLQSKINCYNPSISKIESLGWTPTTTIRDGFMKTIMSYL